MPDETLHDLMVQVGLVRQRPSPYAAQRPLPRQPQQPYRSAFWDTPEMNQIQQLPSQALGSPRTLPMDPSPRLAQRQQQNDLAQFAMQREAGRNEVNTPPGTYFGQDTLEMTGLPSIARGVGHLRDGEPGEALPEMALGGLGVFGMVAGGGARTPRPRPPLRAVLPEIAAEAPRLPNAPPRLPGRATDGSVLPIRPPEPIRQSMVGGSDDLAEAAAMRPQVRSGPDARPVQARREQLPLTPAEQRLVQTMVQGVDDLNAARDDIARVLNRSYITREQVERAMRGEPILHEGEALAPEAAPNFPRLERAPTIIEGEFTHTGPDGGPVQAGRGTFEEGRPGQYRADQFFPVNEDQYFGDSHTFPNIATTDVPVRDLIGTQDFVMNDFLSRPATARESVIAHYGDDGKLYIVDGHNRVAAAIARGETTIPARVFPSRTAPDGGPVQAGRDADGAALDLDRLKAEGWDTSRAWARVVPDTAADPWEVRPLGRFGPGLYFGDDVVEGQMTSRVNRIGARQGHNAASHRAYIRDGDMATDAEWREAYRRHSKGPLGERNPRDAEQRAVRDLEQRGFIGVVVRDRNDGSMSLNVFRRENILPVPTNGRSGPNGGPVQAGRDADWDSAPLYHGTGGAEFTVPRATNYGPFGEGVYLTPDRNLAQHVADTTGLNNPRVMSFEVRQGQFATKQQAEAADRLALADGFRSPTKRAAEVRRRLEADGFIGVRDPNGSEVVVFDPSNIRPARTAPNAGPPRTPPRPRPPPRRTQ